MNHSRLRVSPELLLSALFDGAPQAHTVDVVGASFDAARGHVVLDIAGPDLPDGREVLAMINVKSTTVSFVPVGPSAAR